VGIPVVANGDISSPEVARDVLARTGADAIMIGRAAQGRPWIFREIAHFLATGEHLPPPDLKEVKGWLLDHLEDHHLLYGEHTGVRSARKHLGWYAQALPLPPSAVARFRAHINGLTTARAQLDSVRDSFDAWAAGLDAPHHPSQEEWKLAA
jgi:tRNA-dihydrouridine synthase B